MNLLLMAQNDKICNLIFHHSHMYLSKVDYDKDYQLDHTYIPLTLIL